MPVVTANGQAPRVVVVERPRTLVPSTARSALIEVCGAESVTTVRDRTAVVQVAAPGPQGPPGAGAGVIDDSVTELNRTWSSSKIAELLGDTDTDLLTLYTNARDAHA